MYNNSSITHIDIEKYNSIEREREKVIGDKEFQKWCKKYNIGSRVEVKDMRAVELQQQYEHNYPKWIARMFN